MVCGSCGWCSEVVLGVCRGVDRGGGVGGWTGLKFI